MIDRKIGVSGLELCHSRKRHELSAGGFDEDLIQRIWVGQELGVRLQDHIMLVIALVERGDLTLTERVIQRAINGGG